MDSIRSRILHAIALGAFVAGLWSCGGEATNSPERPGETGAADADRSARGGGDASSSENGVFDALATLPPFELPASIPEAEPLIARAIDEMEALSVIPRARFSAIVARVNGVPISNRDLAVECVLRFGEDELAEFVRECIVLAEIRGRGIEITDAEIDEAIGDILDENVKTRKHEVFHRRFKTTEGYLRWKGKVRCGLEKAFAQDAGVPRYDPDEDFLSLVSYQTEFFQRYPVQLLTDWGTERLGEGVAAIVNGVAIPIDIVFPFVLARKCEDQLETNLQDLINVTLARQEFAKHEIRVDPVFADQMVEQHRAMSAGPIPWEAIIRVKGQFHRTKAESIAWIRRGFDIWVGLDALLGGVDELQLLEYFRDQQVMIGRAAVKVATLTTLTVDPGTCGWKNAEGRALAAHRITKATEELAAGADFNSVVMKYSESPNERKAVATEIDGEEQPVTGAPRATNVRDSALRDEVAAAAFFAPVGEWIGPVTTVDGYVLVKVLAVKPPMPFPYESEPFSDMNDNGRYDPGEPFDDSEYPNGVWDVGRKSFARNEWLVDRASEWYEGLRERAEIEIYKERP